VQLTITRMREIAGDIADAFADARGEPRRPAGQPGRATVSSGWVTLPGTNLGPTTGQWRYAIARAAQTYQYSPDLQRYKQWAALKLPGPEIHDGTWHIVVSFHHKESRSEAMAALTILTSVEPLGEVDIADRPVIPTARRELSYSGGPPQDDRFLARLEDGLMRALEEWQARI